MPTVTIVKPVVTEEEKVKNVVLSLFRYLIIYNSMLRNAKMDHIIK